MPNQEAILNQTKEFVKGLLASDCTGHDWWHIHRVWRIALYIGQQEQADLYIVQLAALLHDVADWKFYDDENLARERIRDWLTSLDVAPETIEQVCEIVESMSFKGANIASMMQTLEGKVVQDADRLDAMGAIGIARTFAYGGHKNRPIYDPTIKPKSHHSFEEYKKSKSTTVNHFYEKLLLLKDKMNTTTGKRLAAERHAFMMQYLEQFYREWDSVADQDATCT